LLLGGRVRSKRSKNLYLKSALGFQRCLFFVISWCESFITDTKIEEPVT